MFILLFLVSHYLVLCILHLELMEEHLQNGCDILTSRHKYWPSWIENNDQILRDRDVRDETIWYVWLEFKLTREHHCQCSF